MPCLSKRSLLLPLTLLLLLCLSSMIALKWPGQLSANNNKKKKNHDEEAESKRNDTEEESELRLRRDSVVNFHIPKSGGSFVEMVYHSCRERLCHKRTSIAARTFPFNCGPLGELSFPCGVHATFPGHELCFFTKMMHETQPNLYSLRLTDHDLVTSVLVLRDPVDRFVSEYHHTLRQGNHYINETLTAKSCTPWFDNPTEVCNEFRKGNQSIDLQGFAKLPCMSAYNRMTWMLSSQFRSIYYMREVCHDLKIGKLSKRQMAQNFESYLSEALSNVRNITVVGRIDHVNLVFEALSDAFGVRFSKNYSIPHSSRPVRKSTHSIISKGPAKYDNRLYNSIFSNSSRKLLIRWDSWMGRKLIKMGLKEKYDV